MLGNPLLDNGRPRMCHSPHCLLILEEQNKALGVHIASTPVAAFSGVGSDGLAEDRVTSSGI
jgi:hypothetical protein